MTARLPAFDVEDYAALLLALRRQGYALRPVSAIRTAPSHREAYLRHDVDFFPVGSLPMAKREAELGCTSTYYILLSGLYNPHAPANRRVLRALVELGHEVGLHYDLDAYPGDFGEARDQLEHEIRTLERLSGQRVRTISMHQPHKTGVDWFRQCDEYVHPHDPRHGTVVYVSDSCRAWRDETLLSCFRDVAPTRLLLLTHPELWLDPSLEDRMEYLTRVLYSEAISEHRTYYLSEVATIWQTHPAPRLHDARGRSSSANPDAQRPAWRAGCAEGAP